MAGYALSGDQAMTVEQQVAEHYGRSGLLGAIRDGLRLAGADPDRPTIDDLSEFEDFHLGGRAATRALARSLDLRAGESLLDVGCGIGGPARFFAIECGARVTGIDLTPEFVETARALGAMVAPDIPMDFAVGSALALPLEADRFDVATLIHVGMNIEDKSGLFREVARVLAPGGRFGVYDAMRLGDADPDFPVPWASQGETSFLATPAFYRKQLEKAGFQVRSEQARGDLATQFLKKVGTPLGPQIVMGENAPTKVGNMRAALEAGLIAPVEIVAILD